MVAVGRYSSVAHNGLCWGKEDQPFIIAVYSSARFIRFQTRVSRRLAEFPGGLSTTWRFNFHPCQDMTNVMTSSLLLVNGT